MELKLEEWMSDGSHQTGNDAGAAHPNTVLVIDDDEAVRELVSEILRRSGIRVQSFADALSAWQFLKGGHADIIISDVDMKGMGGLELLKTVKKTRQDTKCIILSGNPAHIRKASELGADAFLEKPFDVSSLLKVIHCLD